MAIIEQLKKETQGLQDDLDGALADLETAAGTARVKLHLAGMDAKKEWSKIEDDIAMAKNAAKAGTRSALATVKLALQRVERFVASV